LIARQNDTDEAAIEAVGDIFAGKTRAEWDRLLDDQEVCYAPILDLSETCQNPQVAYRRMVDEVIWPDGSPGKQAAVVPKFSLTPGTLRRPPSRPGQHSYEILGELGLDSDAIAKLEAEGVVKGRKQE
jgi:alpha-methylacyl-CoA racemase